jgi:hypothetical protein
MVSLMMATIDNARHNYMYHKRAIGDMYHYYI